MLLSQLGQGCYVRYEVAAPVSPTTHAEEKAKSSPADHLYKGAYPMPQSNAARVYKHYTHPNS